MVTATCFAAIAAGLSVWAALGQEKATYESQLYSKQVDVMAPLLFKLQSYSSDLDDFLRELDGPISADTLDNLKSGTAGLYDTIQQQSSNILAIFPDNVAWTTNDICLSAFQLQLWLGPESAGKVIYKDSATGVRSIAVSIDSLKHCVLPLLHAGRPVIESSCPTLPKPIYNSPCKSP